MENTLQKQKLIVTIIKKGNAKKIVEATKEVGVEGGTTLIGKGTSAKDFSKYFGTSLKSDREIVLTLVSDELVDTVFETIKETGKLKKPGNGVCFIMNVDELTGIAHLLN